MVSDRVDFLLAHHQVLVRPKSDSWIMRTAGAFLGRGFMQGVWTTIRLPFCPPVIYYPSRVIAPLSQRYEWVLEHELMHVAQFRPWYGPVWMFLLYFVLPLPVGFSGRWFVEREAYLGDIRRGVYTAEAAARQLKTSYIYPWPERWMVRWFHRNRDRR